MAYQQYEQLALIYSKLQEISHLLNIQTNQQAIISTESDLLSNIHTILNTFLEALRIKSTTSITSEQRSSDMYQKIQQQLQRQENINRAFIKKQFEFKQYQKCLTEELAQERKNNKQLQTQLSKFNDLVHNKDFQIHHLNNEKKMMAKDKRAKDPITIETLLNDKINQISQKQTGSNSIAKHGHQKSDQLTSKRPATAHTRKKSSITKR